MQFIQIHSKSIKPPSFLNAPKPANKFPLVAPKFIQQSNRQNNQKTLACKSSSSRFASTPKSQLGNVLLFSMFSTIFFSVRFLFFYAVLCILNKSCLLLGNMGNMESIIKHTGSTKGRDS